MKKIEKIVFTWGIFDLSAAAWYLAWNIYYGKLPIANDVQSIIENSTSFGIPSLTYLALFGLLMYFSLLVSGLFLIKHRKAGAIISYLQTPFRLLMVIPPSIFFILWPLKYLFDRPPVLVGISFVLLSELCKLVTVIKWHKNYSSTELVA